MGFMGFGNGSGKSTGALATLAKQSAGNVNDAQKPRKQIHEVNPKGRRQNNPWRISLRLMSPEESCLPHVDELGTDTNHELAFRSRRVTGAQISGYHVLDQAREEKKA